MPSQNSRTRAVIPGKAILGKAGAEKAQNSNLGGAVVPGRAILGSKAEQENAQALAARAARLARDPKNETGKVEPPAKSTLDAALPPGRSSAERTKPADPTGLSENEAIEMLDADPDSWSEVLDMESDRPEGVRAAVAAHIVIIAEKATENPVPAEAIDRLKVIAGLVEAAQ